MSNVVAERNAKSLLEHKNSALKIGRTFRHFGEDLREEKHGSCVSRHQPPISATQQINEQQIGHFKPVSARSAEHEQASTMHNTARNCAARNSKLA